MSTSNSTSTTTARMRGALQLQELSMKVFPLHRGLGNRNRYALLDPSSIAQEGPNRSTDTDTETENR